MARLKEFDYQEKLATARDLFWNKGYNATSLNDLVQTLQLNRSSIYHTYGNKHSLFIKCLTDYVTAKEKSYLASAAKGNSPLASVIYIIKDVVKEILIDTKTCLSVKSTFELGRIDRDVNSLLEKQALNSVRLFENLLSQAKEKGEISQDKDPSLLAYFILSNFTSIWNADILFKDKKLTRQLTDFLIATIKN